VTLQAQPHDHGGVVILHGQGDFDAYTVPTLWSPVSSLAANAPGVVIDLSDVTFFDSAAVRLLDGISRECGHHNTPLRVVAPPDTPAHRVLDIAGMITPSTVDTLTDALTALAEGRPLGGSPADPGSQAPGPSDPSPRGG
jgi:anti-anti-sigma factor